MFFGLWIASLTPYGGIPMIRYAFIVNLILIQTHTLIAEERLQHAPSLSKGNRGTEKPGESRRQAAITSSCAAVTGPASRTSSNGGAIVSTPMGFDENTVAIYQKQDNTGGIHNVAALVLRKKGQAIPVDSETELDAALKKVRKMMEDGKQVKMVFAGHSCNGEMVLGGHSTFRVKKENIEKIGNSLQHKNLHSITMWGCSFGGGKMGADAVQQLATAAKTLVTANNCPLWASPQDPTTIDDCPTYAELNSCWVQSYPSSRIAGENKPVPSDQRSNIAIGR